MNTDEDTLIPTGQTQNIVFLSNFRVGQTAEFAHIALQRMGHNLISYTPSDDVPDNWMGVDPQVDAVKLVESLDVKPDLFLMVESSTGQPILPKRIEELQIPTAYWLYDNYLNIRWNKEIAALFDYVFFAQVNRLEFARNYGRGNLYWLPFAADEIFHRDFKVERDIDIGYVGTITGQKQQYFKDLQQSGLKVKTNDRYLSYQEIGQFYSRCKLVYNILARRDMNVRTFEASAAGALVVNQRWIDEGCQMIFREGESMMFHDFTDAPKICMELLGDDKRRDQMGQRAKEIVMGEHTYRHRMEKLLAITSNGITKERLSNRKSHIAPVAEALTCQHSHFQFKERSKAKFKAALGKSLFKTVIYIVKYGFYRVREKLEKLIWSIGKAPV